MCLSRNPQNQIIEYFFFPSQHHQVARAGEKTTWIDCDSSGPETRVSHLRCEGILWMCCGFIALTSWADIYVIYLNNLCSKSTYLQRKVSIMKNMLSLWGMFSLFPSVRCCVMLSARECRTHAENPSPLLGGTRDMRNAPAADWLESACSPYCGASYVLRSHFSGLVGRKKWLKFAFVSCRLSYYVERVFTPHTIHSKLSFSGQVLLPLFSHSTTTTSPSGSHF